MRKLKFYTMVRQENEYIAMLQDGYTDGTYNYYKKGTAWYAIHPDNGLSINWASTRKAAAEGAHSPKIVERIAAAIERRPEVAADFAAAVAAAKEAA